MMFIVQVTHMAHFHQVTSISITRIPLISAPMQTDKQKAVVSLKVLGAAEVCINSQQCLILFFLILLASPLGGFSWPFKTLLQMDKLTNKNRRSLGIPMGWRQIR